MQTPKLTNTILVSILLIPVLLIASWFAHPHSAGVMTNFQAAKLTAMLAGLRDGQFPVRWASGFGNVQGAPIFEFTGPLPYYVGAGLMWLGIPVNKTLTTLIAMPLILNLFGGYLLGRKVFGKWGGGVGAISMCLLPFQNVNQAWVIMSLPWILFSTVTIIRPQKKMTYGWQLLLAALVTLFLSQTQSLLWWLIAGGLFGAFTLITWLLSARYLRPLLIIKLTTLLALGVSAFYLLPLFGEQRFDTQNQPQVADSDVSKVTPLIDRSQEKLFSINSTTPVKLDLPIPDFPGWQFELDGQPTTKIVPADHSLAVQVPSGSHTVGILFADSPIRLFADLISLGSVVILLGCLISLRDVRRV